MNEAITVVDEYFKSSTKKHYEKLGKALKMDDEKKEVIDEILKCNPKPGNTSKGDAALFNQYIIPDFTIVNNNHELELKLNSGMHLNCGVSQEFREMMQDYKAGGKKDKKHERGHHMFIKQKIDSAKWFIDAIRQRQQTLWNTMYHIMAHQYDFFLTGDEMNMKPMILKDIADVTGWTSQLFQG